MVASLEDEVSVEQRCARIRGRMTWILSQLEGDGAGLMAEFGVQDAARFENELAQQRLEHEAKLEEELDIQRHQLQSQFEADLAERLAQVIRAVDSSPCPHQLLMSQRSPLVLRPSSEVSARRCEGRMPRRSMGFEHNSSPFRKKLLRSKQQHRPQRTLPL